MERGGLQERVKTTAANIGGPDENKSFFLLIQPPLCAPTSPGVLRKFI